MKSNWSHLEQWRVQSEKLHSDPGSRYGAFVIPHPFKGWWFLEVIACAAWEGSKHWDHVSVKARDDRNKTRIPGWEEMDHIKRLFWDDHEVVVQYHIHGSAKVNCHPHVLHLWSHVTHPFPLPPISLV